ncbi:MAG TPA: hypothetical protein VF110_09785 [Burkholderiales bacterium]
MRAVPLLLAALLAACSHEPKPTLAPAEGALDELRAAVVREVKDPQRARAAVALVDEMEKLVAATHAGIRAHNDKLKALNANYDATAEEFRAAFRDFNAARDRREDQTLELNRRAKALLTAGEWRELAKLREEAIRKAVAAGSEL